LLLLLALVAALPSAAGDHESGEVALDGYCPVAYAAMGKAVKGDPKIASEYHGTTYYLANAKAKKMFDKAPGEYVVAYDGFCAAGVAKGMKVESDPELFLVSDGRTYLFSTEEARMMFTQDSGGMVAMADKNWDAEDHGHGHDH